MEIHAEPLYLCPTLIRSHRLIDSTIEAIPQTASAFIHRFDTPIEGISLPDLFAFPFYYDPHRLSVLAAEQLQSYLQHQTDFEHNFGLNPSVEGHAIGKMFGVLVIQEANGDLGYLTAFSGKLADSNDHKGFVPPIFDMLRDGDFFNEGMKVLNPLNAELEGIKASSEYKKALKDFDSMKASIDEVLRSEKKQLKTNKRDRKIERQAAVDLNDEDRRILEKKLIKKSLTDHQEYKTLEKYWQIRLFYQQLEVEKYEDRINELKVLRKELSVDLQNQLFDQYNFLNQAGESKNVLDIFKNTIANVPPSGAGECAAPKLFQFAFQHNLKPICMAEFWWGKPPKSDVKIHGNYYPACRGKCEPILGHMLQGLPMEANPMLVNPAVDKTIDIVYEDDDLVVIHKPEDMLSVPGKTIEDSVWLRMKKRYPEATGPLIVHRLDMSTSGILLIAKSKEVHKHLQSQFIKRTVKKRYVAILDGQVKGEEGTIDLPLRVDLDDRPRQLVCHEHGKSGRTQWKVLERSQGRTRVHFYPITGRTHQLRVHAAHSDGLSIPIVGDDLYGKKDSRLYLHAEWIQFTHPSTEEIVEIQVDAEF